jgi:hypothetical protein
VDRRIVMDEEQQTIEERRRELIGQAVGEASMCWEDVSAAGVFDSMHAVQIVDRLYDDLFREDR